jgi:hypothetical protein
MNPLKERTATTKVITTLFISSVLLVGFMGMSLTLSQTASATVQGGPPADSPSENRPTPQCADDEVFNRGGCAALECPTGDDIVERDGQCFRVTETPVDKVCPPNFAKEGDTCRSTATTAPNCGPQTFNTATGKCETTNPRGGTTPTGRDPCPAENDKLEGTSGSFTCRSTLTTDERVCPTGEDIVEHDGQCFRVTETPVDKVLGEPRRPGQGNID